VTTSSSTTLPAGTSTTTTAPAPSTTSTTLAPCVGLTDPFDLLACRIDVLADRVDGESALGAAQAKLAKRLEGVTSRLEKARSSCAVGKTGRARSALGKVGRALAQFAKILASKKARSVPEPLRFELTAIVQSLAVDVSMVRAGLACP
jgi:hypothetical protein